MDVKEMLNGLAKWQMNLESWSKQLENYLNRHPEVIEAIKYLNENIQRWPELQKKMFEDSARIGWFINNSADAIRKCMSIEAVDTKMITEMKSGYAEIIERAIIRIPHRKGILERIRMLYESGDYEIVLPILFSQLDGLCKDLCGCFLFTDKKDRDNLLTSMINDDAENILELLLHPLRIQESLVFCRIKAFDVAQIDSIPNRNIIMHGERTAKSYGTQVNVLKVFSLLGYLIDIAFPASISEVNYTSN